MQNKGYSDSQMAYYPPPVAQQPQPVHNTTVIVQQPGNVQNQREWSTGTCDCCNDFGICLCGCFCQICLACQVSSDLGESACLPCCVPGWLIALRAVFRTKQNIRGTICDDCIYASCCGPLILCQLAREVKILKGQGAFQMR